MFDCLGIDWGTKKSGIALGSSATFLFIPKDICLTINLISDIAKYELDYQIKFLIIGLPFNFQGQDTKITIHIRTFISILKNKFPEIVVNFVNESGTSKESKNLLDKQKLKNQKILVDSLAAVKILERYFLENHKKLK